ncbi:hypothetical protein RHGRI_026371 [Rhododendron griersonianum]|uniref:Uncharacterized protein n=1 Tax=Rhododendron griersonianum TaxID=479676 RepID=A0AAV6ISG1_9ERIC|nr:hypothetical protein RHGRI_026371 [Rhododendron griersonianum]
MMAMQNLGRLDHTTGGLVHGLVAIEQGITAKRSCKLIQPSKRSQEQYQQPASLKGPKRHRKHSERAAHNSPYTCIGSFSYDTKISGEPPADPCLGRQNDTSDASYVKNPPPGAPASQVQTRGIGPVDQRHKLIENQVQPSLNHSQQYTTIADVQALLHRERTKNTIPYPPNSYLHFGPSLAIPVEVNQSPLVSGRVSPGHESPKHNRSKPIAATTSSHPSYKFQGEEGIDMRFLK